MDDQRPEESSTASFVSVAVIDTCDNIPDDSAGNSAVHGTNNMPSSASSSTTLPLRSGRCRGKRKDGGSVGGVGGDIGQTINGSRSKARKEVNVGNNNKLGARTSDICYSSVHTVVLRSTVQVYI